jgi:isochorismate pyruvate lyase
LAKRILVMDAGILGTSFACHLPGKDSPEERTTYMEVINTLQPADCADMQDIRSEIDRLDQAVIKLLGKRFQYVIAASKFKTSTTSVRAPERFQAMLATRREWACAEGLNADAIEKMYSDLVNHFIAEEMKHWAAQQPER